MGPGVVNKQDHVTVSADYSQHLREKFHYSQRSSAVSRPRYRKRTQVRSRKISYLSFCWLMVEMKIPFTACESNEICNFFHIFIDSIFQEQHFRQQMRMSQRTSEGNVEGLIVLSVIFIILSVFSGMSRH